MERHSDTDNIIRAIRDEFRMNFEVPCDDDDRRVQEIVSKVIEVIKEQPEAKVTVYDKLVRDKIPEIIIQDGKVVVIRKLNDEEYKIHLKKKLKEEVDEFLENVSLDEFVDVTEVMEAIRKVYGYSEELVASVKSRKISHRGGFSNRILLMEVREMED